MGDNIRVSLVPKLAPYIVDSQKVPGRFDLNMIADCRSLDRLKFVCDILADNRSISWFAVCFDESKKSIMTEENLKGILTFLANNPSLKVAEIFGGRTNASNTTELGSLFVKAASKNYNIEKIHLRGSPCSLVSEISSIKELELAWWPQSETVLSWPKNPCRTLRLSTRPSLVSQILKEMTACKSNAPIRHLHMNSWSWSLPTYLSSSNSSLESLHFYDVNFCHDEETGRSAIDGLIWGLKGSPTTTTLGFWDCEFDSGAATKLLQELRSPLRSIKSLYFSPHKINEDLIQFWDCESLESLGFDSNGNSDIMDANLDVVKAALNRGTLSRVSIPTERLAALGPSLKNASTNGALTSLTIPYGTDSSQDDVDCLVNLLKDEACQLQHLDIWEFEAFEPKIICALEGSSRLRSLSFRVDSSQIFSSCVNALAKSLPKIKSLQTLRIILDVSLAAGRRVTAQLEEQLAGAVAKNWSLENLAILKSESETSGLAMQEYHSPIITFALQSKLNDFMKRNRAKRAIKARGHPNVISDYEKGMLLKDMETYWKLPDGLTLAFWMLEQSPGSFF